MELLISTCVLLVALGILLRRIPLSFASPVYVLIGTYLLLLIGGTFLYDPAYRGGSGVRLFLSRDDSYAMAASVMWLLTAFSLGASLFASPRHRNPISMRRAIGRGMQFSSMRAVAGLLLACCSLLLIVFGVGLENVYSRTGYMAEEHHIIKIIGYACLPVGVIALGAVSAKRNSLFRAAAIAGAIASLALTLALNTRMFCLVPALFFGGAAMLRQNRMLLRVALIASIIIAPFLLIVPLTGRSMTTQGVLSLPDLLHELSRTHLDTSAHAVLNNLFVSAPITTRTMATAVDDNLHYVAVGINPLPGFMTDWKSSQRRINGATPFNAVGDLLRGGLPIGMLYFALVGIYFSHIGHNIRSSVRSPLSLFALMALSYIFAFMTLQYPLRNSTRLIYYMIAIEAVVWLRAQRFHPGGRPIAEARQIGHLPALSHE
jgi:hypothetical protein